MVNKSPYRRKPYFRNAIIQKLFVGNVCEYGAFYRTLRLMACNGLHHFPDFHNLCRASLRMHFQLAFFGPGVSLVVMIHIAEQQTLRRAMYDNANIHAHRQGPKIFVLAALQFVEAKPRTGWIDLSIKSRLLDQLLFIGGQLA